jgi:hypothetical protein
MLFFLCLLSSSITCPQLPLLLESAFFVVLILTQLVSKFQ